MGAERDRCRSELVSDSLALSGQVLDSNLWIPGSKKLGMLPALVIHESPARMVGGESFKMKRII